MKYITLNDLTRTIRTNLGKIPHDIDFVVGIPRSGMIVASIISEYINVPLIDIDSFVRGEKPTGGNRVKLLPEKHTGRVLVVDDTCFSGSSMKGAKIKLCYKAEEYQLIYLAAYLEGKGDDELDIWLEDVRQFTQNSTGIVLYEWNIFHHYPFIMEKCLYDMDGVICVNPPDERNKEEYEDYIKNAIPLFMPTTKFRGIVTYRLNIYKEITQNWLNEHNVDYDYIVFFHADSWEERNESGIFPEVMKGKIYKNDKNAELFIESDDAQAKVIHHISGKPVLSIEKNFLYGGE